MLPTFSSSDTNLLFSSSNMQSVLDIVMGEFTAGSPGTYTVTWSYREDLGHRDTTSFLCLPQQDLRHKLYCLAWPAYTKS